MNYPLSMLTFYISGHIKEKKQLPLQVLELDKYSIRQKDT